MQVEDERLVGLLANLHELGQALPARQDELVTRITSISLLLDSQLRRQLRTTSAQIAQDLGIRIDPVARERLPAIIGIGEDSGIIRRGTRSQESDLEDIVNVAFLVGYASTHERAIEAFLPSLRVYADMKGMADHISPLLIEGSIHYDPHFHVNKYLVGVMRLGHAVGNVVRS